MIVLDASAYVAAILAPEATGERIRDRMRDTRLAAPALFDFEVLSALRGLVRSGRVSERFTAGTLRRLQRLPVERVPAAPLADRILQLRHNLTAYDAAYVALAEALACPLVTADGRLAAAPGIRCRVEVVG